MNPLLYKNHFAFGDNKPSYQTSYNTSHVEYLNQMPPRANDSRRDRTSNIVLGYAQTEKKSEAQDKYILLI